MNCALLISVRFHDGRYHGAGDWPPSPARLFQALVAASPKDKGMLEKTGRDALAWLEQLAAPVIAAPAKQDGQPGFKLFVPNNDLDAKGGDIRRVAEIRSATKHIRPRLFDASVPLLYVWRFEGDDTHATRIREIADGLYQLGRGVDMAWAVGEVLGEADADARLAGYRGVIYRPSEKGNGTALDCPGEGSLESLETRYKAGAQRFRRIANRTEFANAPRPRFRSVAYDSPATHLLFDLRRTTDSGSPFALWPLSQTAALVQKLRDGAEEKLKRHYGEGIVNKVLIGRDATEADKALRIRILPLPSIGYVHADRSIRRVLVEVPPDCPMRADDVAWAFSGLEVAPQGVDTETGAVELVTANDDSMLGHYGIEDAALARVWRSITPLALPDETKRRRIDPARLRAEARLPAEQRTEAKRGAERLNEVQLATGAVIQALRHAEIRTPVSSVRVQREPFEAKGSRVEAFAPGTRFAKERLWHAQVTFSTPLRGPLLLVLGDGRYCGLGLMAPVKKSDGVCAFSIAEGLTADADPATLSVALRRAVMARVQVEIGRGNPLHMFFTGHEADGEAARTGHQAHLAFAADLARRRFIIVSPHLLEGRSATRQEHEHLAVLNAAVEELTELRAGAAGLLRLVPCTIDQTQDALFTPTREWLSATDYRPTRYGKRISAAETLKTDLRSEIHRRGLPAPRQIEVLAADEGPRGGVSGRLRITFGTAVSGPLLLGRTCHLGGGLFQGPP